MSEAKRALVLHLSSGGEPVLVAITPEYADQLPEQLPALIRGGKVEVLPAANGSSIVVNFAHVVAAHVDVIPGIGMLYGSKSRDRL